MEGYGTGEPLIRDHSGISPLTASLVALDAYIHLNKLSSSAEPLQ